ncbi:MAG: RNA polymerase-binding protein DksA [Arenimonas sp.]|nr:RNA polymerase-binding protein DksA [Arenimonas sp.]
MSKLVKAIKPPAKKANVKVAKKVPAKKQVVVASKKPSAKKANVKAVKKSAVAKPLAKKVIKPIAKKPVKVAPKKLVKTSLKAAPKKGVKAPVKVAARKVAKSVVKVAPKKIIKTPVKPVKKSKVILAAPAKPSAKKIAVKKVAEKTAAVKKKIKVEAIIHTAIKVAKTPAKIAKPEVVVATTVATKNPDPVVKIIEPAKVIANPKVEKKTSSKKSSGSKMAEPLKPYVQPPPRELPNGERAGFIKRDLPAEAALKQKSVKRVTLPAGYKPSEKEDYMNDMQLEYFRQKLIEERETLLIATKETINDLKEEARDVGDEAERASRETENFFELRTRDRYRKLLYKIDKIITTIDDGTYGYCVDTGEEIGLKRLEGRPMAERTVDAQERWEHKKKQLGD